jgi:hypothetical protein
LLAAQGGIDKTSAHDFKAEITDLLRLKDKHVDKFQVDSIKIIAMYAYKYKFIAQLKQGSINVSKALKLDHTKNIDGEVYVPETVEALSGNNSNSLKALLNV